MTLEGIVMDEEAILRLKVRLLTEGATLPESEWGGRKGGAGPVGGRYFFLPNGRACGIPIRSGKMAEKFNSAPLTPTKNPMIWTYDNEIQLKMVPRPKFYNLSTKDGVPYFHIALLHGSECLATTIYQSCRYWSTGTQCKFCTIPVSYESGDTILEKAPDQIIEVIQAAEKEGVIHNVLLTTGTINSDDLGCSKLIEVVHKIREVSKIPIAVQFEPPLNHNYIEELARAGVNAVAMHIESLDEQVRQKICPGKFKHGSPNLYSESWKKALSLFDRGQVSTYILHGLGEDVITTLNQLEELAILGVMPVVAPVRPAGGSQLVSFTPTYVGAFEESVDFYKQVGRILYKWHLNPEKTLGGCHECGGCTPIQEAFDWAHATKC
jgi:radical SAM protein (TIGR04043 family)